MKYRTLGKTGMNVSEVSLGTWQLGAKWGDPFDEKTALKTLESAVEQGVNFFDTADVYNDGLSEQAIGTFLKSNRGDIFIATKCGRKLDPHVSSGYNSQNIFSFVEASLRRLQLETIDLIQLHCPPTEVYYRPEVFGALDTLKEQGKIRHYGVSVEKIEEALKAMEFPGVETVQLIFNIFRQRPINLLFQQAADKNIGIIVRVPLASGLLTGKFSRQTRFSEQDHRFYNRDGEQFDKGETFAGVPFETGLEAVEQLKEIIGTEIPMSQAALRWILMFPEISTVIPGASKPEHLVSNVKASKLPSLTEQQVSQIRALYESIIKPHVHQLW
jgi:aryl-alcohol dehydrogenase-like predicted oxidoreductase